MKVKDAITVITVSNLARSREWYSALFGKGPDLEPFPGNLEFKAGGAWVQISEGEVSPSSWSLQFEVEDLSQEHERLREAGVAATEIGTAPGIISWFDLKDPDGNSMRWFQVLTTDSKVTGKQQQSLRLGEEGRGDGCRNGNQSVEPADRVRGKLRSAARGSMTSCTWCIRIGRRSACYHAEPCSTPSHTSDSLS